MGINMRKRMKGKTIENNSGSTLIVVLVAVSFLMIIGAIVMSVSTANLRMKQIEYAAKENFYVDELGLEDVYSGIGRDVSKALSKAYSKTLAEATADGMYPTQKAAYIAFAGGFYEELKELYGDDTDNKHADTLAKLNGYITRSKVNETLQVISYDGISVVPDTETTAELWKYILKGVKVKYLEDERYESLITTDIVIEVPYIDFFQNFSQVLDYALIGNKGISFVGTSGANTEAMVEGNVYAGIDASSANAAYMGYLYDGNVYDGMNFYKSVVTFKDSNYIISKGDFNICESAVKIDSKISDATKEAQSNLWVENIRTVEAARADSLITQSLLPPSSLDAVANIYVADDMELNARKSEVTLKGNYYGYNYNNSGGFSAYKTWENTYLEDKYHAAETRAAHTVSSSIMVNANNSVLDLSGLNTLMVAGVAYVDIKNPTKTYQSLASGEAGEYRTAESVAMRYNQLMYLAPPEILNGASNPQKDGSTDVSVVCPSDSVKLQEWFGVVEGYVVTESEGAVIPVVYTDNGVSYTYYYLNIKPGMAKSYVNSFMSMETAPDETATAHEKQKWALKQMIQGYAGTASIASHITMDASGGTGGATIYTTGLLTDTGEAEQTLQRNDIALDDMAGRSTNMQRHYVQLYVNLEPKSVTAIEDSVRADETYPLTNFLDLAKFPGSLHIEEKEVEGVSNTNVWIMEEIAMGGVHPVLDLSADTKKGIVLCSGDLTIKGNGGTFEGLIIATGKITVEGNVTIKANKGVVQSVLEAEQRTLTELSQSEAEAEDLTEYASYYFRNTILADLTSHLIDMDKRVTSTEYQNYIYYKNWKKGQNEETP